MIEKNDFRSLDMVAKMKDCASEECCGEGWCRGSLDTMHSEATRKSFTIIVIVWGCESYTRIYLYYVN